jgi:tetratricopeptide (TPR) repeat protein
VASIPPGAREAMELARSGDLVRAIRSGEAAVAETPDHPGLRLFVGLLHTSKLDLRSALPHLRQAAALVPGDPLPRLELARALAGLGELDEAEHIVAGLASGDSSSLSLLRVRALILQRRGEHREAARLYRIATGGDPADFESWAQLGICQLAMGEPAPAAGSLRRSLEIRSDQPAILLKLAEAQAQSGQAEQGLRATRAMARSLPYDPAVRVAIARLEDLLGRPDRAEAALAEALDLDPDCLPALMALANLMERDNRVEALESLLGRIHAAGAHPPDTALLRARLLYRRGDLEAALAAAKSASEAVDAGARAYLIGQIEDRLGHSEAAFAAFAEMNRLAAIEIEATKEMAADFRAQIVRLKRTVTRKWYKGWSSARP